MNEHQVRGIWSQLKGRSKVAWGDVTDDERARVSGTTDQIYGRMQEAFGNMRERFRRGFGRRY
ncbi:MAG: CsbD family protein [Polyangiales bacterium]